MHSRFIHAKDSNSSAALGILACLCHNNYLVGKLLLASMTAEERKDLYASSFEDVKTKVTDTFRILKKNRLKKLHFRSMQGCFKALISRDGHTFGKEKSLTF